MADRVASSWRGSVVNYQFFHDMLKPSLTGIFGSDPVRIDQNNANRELTTEIMRNLEESEAVVADLTNERPNCYAEIGYSLGFSRGRGESSNTVLIAREDHNPASPNYKPDGPRVHFDLSTYPI